MAMRNGSGSSFGALDKKIPQNARYSGVNSRLDTGASLSKSQAGSVSAGERAKRLNEVFKRIRPATLSRLIHEQQEDCQESVFSMGAGDDRDGAASVSSVRASKAGPRTVATCASVGSVGSVVSVIHSDTTIDQSRELTLIDLREPEDFAKCHLPLAVSYPATLINRDRFIPELETCRRDPTKLLVVYHNSDITTAPFATLLVQKGWENLYLLSGGFDEVVQSYPEILEGEVPDRPLTGGSMRSSSSTRSGQRSVPGAIRKVGPRAGSASRALQGGGSQSGLRPLPSR